MERAWVPKQSTNTNSTRSAMQVDNNMENQNGITSNSSNYADKNKVSKKINANSTAKNDLMIDS